MFAMLTQQTSSTHAAAPRMIRRTVRTFPVNSSESFAIDTVQPIRSG